MLLRTSPGKTPPLSGALCWFSDLEHLPSAGWSLQTEEGGTCSPGEQRLLNNLKKVYYAMMQINFLIPPVAFQEIRRDFMKMHDTCAFYLYSISPGILAL